MSKKSLNDKKEKAQVVKIKNVLFFYSKFSKACEFLFSKLTVSAQKKMKLLCVDKKQVRDEIKDYVNVVPSIWVIYSNGDIEKFHTLHTIFKLQKHPYFVDCFRTEMPPQPPVNKPQTEPMSYTTPQVQQDSQNSGRTSINSVVSLPPNPNNPHNPHKQNEHPSHMKGIKQPTQKQFTVLEESVYSNKGLNTPSNGTVSDLSSRPYGNNTNYNDKIEKTNNLYSRDDYSMNSNMDRVNEPTQGLQGGMREPEHISSMNKKSGGKSIAQMAEEMQREANEHFTKKQSTFLGSGGVM